jgi:parallel beta-helix repeat protein
MEAKLQVSTVAARVTALLAIATLAMAVLLVTVIHVDSARASHVGCGDTITADTKLDSDLINCPNNGVVIGADGVTLDLNGHLVDGDDREFKGCDPRHEICDSGLVNDGHDRVTVMNGRVRGFAVGVLFGTSTPTKVRQSRVLGISSVKNQFLGIGQFDVVQGLVRNCSGNSLAGHGGVGLAVAESTNVRVLGGTFKGNSDHGILFTDTTHSVVNENRVSHTATGIFLLDSSDNQVGANRMTDVGEGILVDHGLENMITRNRVSHAGGRGKGGEGIAIESGRDNLVSGNVVTDVRGIGIRLGLQVPPRGAASNVVRRNQVRESRKDGFRVEDRAGGNRLVDNLAVDSGDDGFDIESRSTRLTGNRALDNADLGFEAVPGTKDGGGNVAHDNGDRRGCTNIACR